MFNKKEKEEINYELLFKKLYYEQDIVDAELFRKTKEEIATNCSASPIKTLVAHHKIKNEVKFATKNNEVSKLFEKWGKEIANSEIEKQKRKMKLEKH